MSEPTTTAGRKLLAELSENPLPGALYALNVVALRVHAIEAEAVAAEREKLLSRITPDLIHDLGWAEMDGGVPDVCNRFEEHELFAAHLIAALLASPVAPEEKTK